MRMAPTDYSLADVAALTETPVRTIRYYIAQGLLPSSGRVGPAARYDDGVRRPAPRHQTAPGTAPAAGGDPRGRWRGCRTRSSWRRSSRTEVPPPDSAAEYVRLLLGVAEERVSYAAVPPPAPSVAPAAAPPAAPGRLRPSSWGLRSPDAWTTRLIRGPPGSRGSRAAGCDPGPGRPVARSRGRRMGRCQRGRGARAGDGRARSHWERIAITPDIEIHIRRPLSRRSAKRAERLVEFARDIFEEGA